MGLRCATLSKAYTLRHLLSRADRPPSPIANYWKRGLIASAEWAKAHSDLHEKLRHDRNSFDDLDSGP